jgi:hypothetical protein
MRRSLIQLVVGYLRYPWTQMRPILFFRRISTVVSSIFTASNVGLVRKGPMRDESGQSRTRNSTPIPNALWRNFGPSWTILPPWPPGYRLPKIPPFYQQHQEKQKVLREELNSGSSLGLVTFTQGHLLSFLSNWCWRSRRWQYCVQMVGWRFSDQMKDDRILLQWGDCVRKSICRPSPLGNWDCTMKLSSERGAWAIYCV